MDLAIAAVLASITALFSPTGSAEPLLHTAPLKIDIPHTGQPVPDIRVIPDVQILPDTDAPATGDTVVLSTQNWG